MARLKQKTHTRGGSRIVEATHDLVLMPPSKEALECAVRADPRNCALAQAIREQVGATDVEFFRSVCFIDGVKYRLRTQEMQAIKLFDKTGVFPPAGIRLFAIAGTAYSRAGKKAAVARRKKELENGTAKMHPKRRNRRALDPDLRLYRSDI